MASGDISDTISPRWPGPSRHRCRSANARLQLALQEIADFIRQAWIGIGVQQHHGAVADQAIGPGGDHESADQAADGIENAQSEIIAASQRHDGQHAGGGIGQHMDIGGAHIVVAGCRHGHVHA